jgi:hypothetical protein
MIYIPLLLSLLHDGTYNRISPMMNAEKVRLPWKEEDGAGRTQNSAGRTFILAEEKPMVPFEEIRPLERFTCQASKAK